MAPAKATMLSTLMDVSDEDDFARTDIDMMPTPDSQPENKIPTKRSRVAKSKPTTATTKATKSRTAARRTSNNGRANVDTKSNSRKALAERINVPNDGNETEEVDDFEEDGEEVKPIPAKRGKVSKATKEEKVLAKPRATKPAAAPKKATRSKQVASEYEVPESQVQLMEIDQTDMGNDAVTDPVPARQVVPRQPLMPQLSNRARSTSRQPDIYSRHRRAGSASDTERAGEPALRRKLGEITRKFENLELKYLNLKELGGNEAQSNFDKLKKSTDQKAKDLDQDEIINSLKRELVAQKALTAESKTLRIQNATLQAENQRITSENKSLSSSLVSLQSESKASHNEIKALQAKVTAMRNNTSESASTAKNIPSSAAKSRVGSAAAAKKEDDMNERMKVMQMKEDLYSDLTGLMIHNVKRVEEEDVFDCIQTGRNGTLRFNLSVSHSDKTTATPGTAFEEEEFAYTPLLDEKNDRQLLDLLPDYLTEDIVFPRPSAAMFYLKIIDCMSKRYLEE